MTNTVFDKTERGRTEIATRAQHLAPRLRTLLLLIDGKRDTAELMGKVAGLGLDEKALVDLLEGGFIAVADAADDMANDVADDMSNDMADDMADNAMIDAAAVSDGSDGRDRSTPDAAPPHGARDQDGAVPPTDTALPPSTPSGTADSASGDDSGLAGMTPPAIDNPALPSGAAVRGILREGETQFQALYNFFNETIRSAIGLRGYGMQLKVERATTVADFRALRQPYLDAVLKAKGPELEHSLRNRLDQLLGLGD